MKRLVTGAIVCLALVAMCSADVLAQGGGGGRGRRRGGGFGGGGAMHPVAMLSFGNEQLQKELKITDEQKEKIKTIGEEARTAGGGGFGGGRNQSAEEREKRGEEMRKRFAETRKKIEEVLDADQKTRLRGIALQTMGTAALTDAEVAKELKLSDDTVKQLKTIAEETAKKRRELFSKLDRESPDEERVKAREEAEKLSKLADEESLAQLSAEQKADLEKMKGAKFEFDRSGFGGGGRGGRGRRGGGDNKGDEKKT